MAISKFRKVSELIHRVDPYDNFPINDWNLNVKRFTEDTTLFQKLILETKPELIIEVGSWMGYSAISMADVIKKNNLDCGIICVDTWLGAREFWSTNQETIGWWNYSNHEHFKTQNDDLELVNGYPSVYYQFLANVIHKGSSKYITPFPQTSSIAGRWFKSNNIIADFIYIDGSHEYEDVASDLKNYWQILSSGGIMIGDDYLIADVKIAVDEFTEKNSLNLNTEQSPFWYFVKE